MRVLVTGASGYIGSHVCEELLATGHDVFGTSRWGSNGNLEVLKRYPNFVPIVVDLTNRHAVKNVLLGRNVDAVVHLGEPRTPRDTKNEEQYSRVCISICENLLDVLQTETDTLRFVYGSSAAVYGESSKIGSREDQDSPLPVSAHGRVKLRVESLIRVQREIYGERFKHLNARIFNVAGASSSGLSDLNGTSPSVFSYLLRQYESSGQPVRMRKTPDGRDYVRDYMHVMDVARTLCDAIRVCSTIDVAYYQTFCQTINVGRGVPVTTRRVVDTFVANDYRVLTIDESSRSVEVLECTADDRKLRQLGMKFIYESLDHMVLTHRWSPVNSSV
jgi:UDP-glucose 4-epimerase